MHLHPQFVLDCTGGHDTKQQKQQSTNIHRAFQPDAIVIFQPLLIGT